MTPVALHPPDAAARLGLDRIRARLDGHARTPYGRERLAALVPSSDAAAVGSALALAGEALDLIASGNPLPVRQTDDVRVVLKRLQPKNARVDGEDLRDVGRVLETLRLLHDGVHAVKGRAPGLWDLASRIVVLKALEDRIARTIDETGQVRDDASPHLRDLSRRLSGMQARLRETLLAALRQAQASGHATADMQPTIRGGRAVIPVRAEAKRKVQGFVHDVSSTGQTVYVEPTSVLDLNNEIRETEVARAHEIERLLAELSAHVRHHRGDLEDGLDALGRLDALASIGRLAAETDALVPEVAVGGPMRLVRARHPLLVLHVAQETAARDDGVAREVVPLDLELGGEAAGTLVITGPNAGGKSVAMKTVGLVTLMAACGLPVPAAPGTRIPLPTQVFVDVGDQQSIQDDLSTFTSHLVNVRRMLEDADDRSLCLLDEAGTGTDPSEGGALAEALLRRLTARGALVVATTHLGALKAFAHEHDGVANGSMAFSRDTLSPTYRFQAGIPGSSYAFEIARRVGIPGPVLDEAGRLAGEGKGRLEDLIATFEARTTEAEARLAEARAQQAEAERVRGDYEARLARLRADADARRAQALAQAEAILADANAAVENTVREIKEAQAETEATRAARARLDEARESVSRRQTNVQRRQKKRAPRASSDSSPAVLTVSGPITVGDQVRVEGAGVGEVLELDDREAVVAFGQLRSRVKTRRLTKVGGPAPQTVRVRAPAATRPSSALTASTRVDLRGVRVEDALHETQRFVDEAIAAGVRSVEILHGKGTGALRQAIHAQLAARPDVTTFEVAPWDQGGDGVTVVRF